MAIPSTKRAQAMGGTKALPLSMDVYFVWVALLGSSLVWVARGSTQGASEAGHGKLSGHRF